MKSLPLVSLTITTKNEEKNIGRCLTSIKKQTYPRIQIIVVDNHSGDKTKTIARKYTREVYNLGPERSSQRNFGMLKKSRGRYLMFLDADMTLSPLLIEKAVLKLEKEGLGGLYIPEVVIADSFWAKVRQFERSFYNATVIDCVRIIRKSIFVKTGGFDPLLIGSEDWDLDKKIRQISRVGLLESKAALIYHHESQFNLLKYWQKKKYYCQSFNRYKSKWGENDPDVRRQFGFFYRYLGVFLEKGKWRRLIKHPLLGLAMYFLRISVGLLYLWKRK